MPNPNGTNQFDRFSAEQPYGAVKKQADLAASAPVVSNPALYAPDRAQARAVRGPVSPPKATKASGGTPPPYEEELVATWAEIAAQPGASELVKSIARRAQGMPRGV